MCHKILRLLVVVLVVTAVTFLLVDLLPGDAAYDLAGQDGTPEDIKALQQELGLTDSGVVRYFRWLGGVLQGDLGASYRTREKVVEVILARLPVTLELMFLAQLIALSLALPAGIICAQQAGKAIDRAINTLAFGVMSVPSFVLALLLIYLLALKFRLFPATGCVPLSEGLGANLVSFVLPASSIALVEWVPLMRVLRGDLISTLKEEYILTARSKGLPGWQVMFRHALRPSSLTMITVLGIHVGHLIGGALIVEIIFALPGLGRLLAGAIFGRDVILLQGCVLVITVGYVGVNFLVDLLYAILDPRIRVDHAVG